MIDDEGMNESKKTRRETSGTSDVRDELRLRAVAALLADRLVTRARAMR